MLYTNNYYLHKLPDKIFYINQSVADSMQTIQNLKESSLLSLSYNLLLMKPLTIALISILTQ